MAQDCRRRSLRAAAAAAALFMVVRCRGRDQRGRFVHQWALPEGDGRMGGCKDERRRMQETRVSYWSKLGGEEVTVGRFYTGVPDQENSDIGHRMRDLLFSF